jgi:hypothetical protein
LGAEAASHPPAVAKGTDDNSQVELHPESAPADGQAGPAAGASVPVDSTSEDTHAAPAPPDKLRTLTIRIGPSRAMAEALVRHLGRDRAAEVRDALAVILSGRVEDDER